MLSYTGMKDLQLLSEWNRALTIPLTSSYAQILSLPKQSACAGGVRKVLSSTPLTVKNLLAKNTLISLLVHQKNFSNL